MPTNPQPVVVEAADVPTYPYNRIVQWLAGPIAIVAGWLATQITLHFGIFGSLGLGSDRIAHAIVVVATFTVGAGLTYAAHHKWMSNLLHWIEIHALGK